MNDVDQERFALAITYRDAFETFPPGQAVLVDLERQFCKKPPLDGSPASMNRTVIVAAQREVVEYIVRQINRANAVPTDPEEENNDG